MEKVTDLLNLSGKTAIVTGGAIGIGYGIAYRLAEAGANVVIANYTANPNASPVKNANEMTASLYFSNPLRAKSVTNLFSTHPPIEERIKRLQQMY